MTILTNVVLGWFVRRGLELGGLLGALWVFYTNLPPASQDAIQQLFTGGWEQVTLGALFPILAALWGYVWSFRSTVKPQVVVDGRQVPIKSLPQGRQTLVEETARTVAGKRGKTLFDLLRGR
jgi:hypothetical protein